MVKTMDLREIYLKADFFGTVAVYIYVHTLEERLHFADILK